MASSCIGGTLGSETQDVADPIIRLAVVSICHRFMLVLVSARDVHLSLCSGLAS